MSLRCSTGDRVTKLHFQYYWLRRARAPWGMQESTAAIQESVDSSVIVVLLYDPDLDSDIHKYSCSSLHLFYLGVLIQMMSL